MKTMNETIADQIARSSMLSDHLPTLLALAGHAAVGERLRLMVEMTRATFDAMHACEGEPEDIFAKPGPRGCDETTMLLLEKAHEAAMNARDLYWSREVCPIIDQAARFRDAA